MGGGVVGESPCTQEFDSNLCICIKTAFSHVTAIPDGFTQIDVINCDPQYIIIIAVLQ